MEKRQLFFLFLGSLIPWTVGNGILPLLPVYAASLGSSPTTAGAYLAVSYAAMTLGALSAGWLSERLHSCRIPLIGVSLGVAPLIWLIGQVTNLVQLTAVTAALWYLGGIGFALISILAGLSAGRDERGKVFGVLSMASPVGVVIGGLASGLIVDRWGFQTMFAVFALFSLLLLVVSFFVKDAPIMPSAREKNAGAARAPGLGRAFWLLFAANLAAAIAGFVGLLGRSLVMAEQDFSATAISSTGAVAGAVALPLGLAAGVLSDRLGRKSLLILGYLAAALGLGLLAMSGALWQFWLAISMMSVATTVSGAVGPALVADLVPRELDEQGPIGLRGHNLARRRSRLCRRWPGHAGSGLCPDLSCRDPAAACGGPPDDLDPGGKTTQGSI